jgi:hemolysin III
MKSKEIIKTLIGECNDEQEIVNASLHLLGIIFGLVGIPFLLFSASHKDLYTLIGITVYSICFMAVFTFSTLYHTFSEDRTKRLFKKLDRISIYFLIAGTYTPLIKFYLFDGVGINMLLVLWFFVLLGVLFEIYLPDRFPIISISFYLLMGLLFMFVPHHFFATMPDKVMMLVVTGVLFYITGVIFYVWHRLTYHHAIWHLFVLTGSICHYLAVLYTV